MHQVEDGPLGALPYRFTRWDSTECNWTTGMTLPGICAPPPPIFHGYATAAASKWVEQSAQRTAMTMTAVIRAQVERVLVQVVMLPVVWMSVCCALGAFMGIECIMTLRKTLTMEEPTTVHRPKHKNENESSDDKADLNDRPVKKSRLRRDETKPRSEAKARATSEKDTTKTTLLITVQATKQDVEAVTKWTSEPSPVTRRRRRRVYIWDLDETLLLFASLYSGQFARTHRKDIPTSVALGEQMMTYLVAVLDRHFYFNELHNMDIDHIASLVENPASAEQDSKAGDSKKASDDKPVDRRAAIYKRIRAIYEREQPVDFLDETQSHWYAAREALVAAIDGFSGKWLREAREVLELTTTRARARPTHKPADGEKTTRDEFDQFGSTEEGEEDDLNVLVTNTQLSPALCKCLIYNLHTYFPIETVYSSSKVHKYECFERIMTQYRGSDVEFIAIGDGAEEEHVSRTLGIAFHRIGTLDDLKQLRYELELVERPTAQEAKAD
ncbi:hypothetical protein Poli38472_006630 [Pythium oligandrum]|uniref:protein-tyrosine-phosphatase n=1 Tax=Pythium oligandrum TaxID=41045 RepID=A0A8K1C554_PYTOL|nr:hypothetical protein Poli38472_006630 [Pythium oligandrum]|eukprot:TMW56620.1 hypothetical protein Poli38472_006630 [Pythium oligandrum]